MSETADTPVETPDKETENSLRRENQELTSKNTELEAKLGIAEKQIEQYGVDLKESQDSLKNALDDLQTYKKPCARCNHDNLIPLKVDPEALKAYFAAIMSGNPFTKEYAIGKDDMKLSVEYRTLTSKEAEDKARMDIKCKTAQTKEGEPKYTVLDLAKINIMAHLHSYKGNKVEKIDLTGEVDAVLKAHNDMFHEAPQQVAEFVARCAGIFTALSNTLFEASMDEDFWKGVGLG